MTGFFEKHLVIKRIVSIVCAYLAVYSISKIFSLGSNISNYFTGMYWGYNIGSVAVFLGGAYLLNRFLKNRDVRLKIISVISGLLLSAACVYGAYAHYINDIFVNTGEGLLQIVLVFGIAFLTIPLSAEIILLIEKGSDWLAKKNSVINMDEPSKKPGLYFLCVWVIIFVSYIPLFLDNWPGNFVFDAKYQMINVLTDSYSTHHPLLHTWLMGAAYKIGLKLGNVSAGFQLYTLLQMLILSMSFAYCLWYMYKKKVYRGIRILSLLWFALFPMNPLFAISATKDVLCAAFFLITVIYYIRLFYDKEKFKWYSYIALIAANVLLALFRNNALYAVLLFAVASLLFTKGLKEKIKVIILFLLIYMLAKFAGTGLVNALDAYEPDTYRETMSVPLQSLARVAQYRRSDLADELYNEICSYIREEDIAQYNPYLSDPIKNNANEVLLRTNTINFFKLWVKVGLQFPDEYFESIVTNTLGYWYPFNVGGYLTMDIALYHTLIGMGPEIEKVDYFPLDMKIYNDWFYRGNYKYVPILGYLFRLPVYVWFYVFGFFSMIYKKNKKGLLLMSLPLVYLLTCMAGPAVAIRYLYSIIVCVPIFIYMMVHAKKEPDKIRNVEEN